MDAITPHERAITEDLLRVERDRLYNLITTKAKIIFGSKRRRGFKRMYECPDLYYDLVEKIAESRARIKDLEGRFPQLY